MRSWFYWDNKYLLKELKPIFQAKYLPDDIFAGLTVACVSIPLSLAIAMASGVPSGLGLVAAIVGGIIAALMGGTRMAVTGPTATMIIVIASTVESQGLAGLLIVGLISGLLQIFCGIFRLGRFAKLVPLPVISAFTAGIGFIILIGQLPNALQLPAPDENHVFYVIKHIIYYITSMNPMAFALALLSLAVLKISPRYFPKLPTPLIAVAIPTLIVYFAKIPNIQPVGTIIHSIPTPSLPDFSKITDWNELIGNALVVFGLASLETLLSSNAVDSMGKGDLHNPNQELIGQGLANTGVAIFGGIPVTGLIARSSINLASGAKTRRSAMIHSLAILAVIYLCPKLIEMIPVCALAAILLSAGLSMMNMREVIGFWKTDKTEVIVYLVTFLAIVATDLIDGVKAGIMVAFLIVALRMLTTRSSVRLWTNQSVLRISLSGNMTFWSFEKMIKIQNYIADHQNLKFVIFEFEELQGMDSTGAKHIVDTTNALRSKGIKVILHNMSLEQQKLVNAVWPENQPFIITVTESDIKDLLEDSGITHSANDILKHGMHKFLDRYAQERKDLLNTLAKEQKPHTLVITCSDSRLNPNAFLSVGLGELFIVRNVGNVIPQFAKDNEYSEGAAIEFALAELKIRNIVICAHTECGAIKTSISDNEIPYPGLNNWLNLIKQGFNENKPQNIIDGVKINLLNQIRHLKSYPLASELLRKGELTISGWIYDVHSANILEWNDHTHDFSPIVKTAHKVENI